MKRSLGMGIATATLMLSGAAFAADMPIKAQRLPSYYNWSGFYVGANAGYGWSSGNGTLTIAGVSGPVSGSGNGFVGGAQAGYNWQIGSAVLGIETDIQYDAAKGSFNGNAGANTFTSTSKVPWFGTVRGRLGYAFDRTMVYITGGGAYGEGKIDGTSSVSGAYSVSKSFMTYTVGGGVEHALWDHWTAKLEYLYIGTPDHVPVPPGTTAITGTINSNIVRAGLNYRF